METEFIKEYASRMAWVFADRAFKAKSSSQADDYVKYVEDRRDFWERVAQLPPNSEHWEFVKRYMSLMSDPKASKMEVRSLYKFLRQRGL
jgi:hypothetical protein